MIPFRLHFIKFKKIPFILHQLQTELSKEFSSEGVELSGGEWQKLAISRGVFRNAEVIVLDEPTAALDPKDINDIPIYQIQNRFQYGYQ